MGASATYYEILKVNRRAAPEGVRAAYRRLAQKYHPDKLPGNTDAVRVMAMLNEAYGVLSDPDRRARYDRRVEDERAWAQRAARRGMTPIEVPTAAWPWYLLFATIAFALAAFATVVYKSMVPTVAVAVSTPVVHNGAIRAPAPSPATPKTD
jgi:curved DNA-binding protein CbpA